MIEDRQTRTGIIDKMVVRIGHNWDDVRLIPHPLEFIMVVIKDRSLPITKLTALVRANIFVKLD